MGEYQSVIGANSASGQSFLNRYTRSGLLIKGRLFPGFRTAKFSDRLKLER
jgi:hypothetical protein